MLTGEILKSEPSRGKTKVTYQFIDGHKTYGPFVEHRPLEENLATWLEVERVRLSVILNPTNYYAAVNGLLDANVGAGTYDVIRTALKDLNADSIKLSEEVSLNVSYPPGATPSPEDVEQKLRDKVDAELGEGKFDQIKTVLAGLGFNNVLIQQKSEVTL